MRDAATRTVTSFRRLLAAPAAAAACAEAEAQALMQGEVTRPYLRAAATLHDLAELVRQNTAFFAREPMVSR